jgi:hypothetical protein
MNSAEVRDSNSAKLSGVEVILEELHNEEQQQQAEQQCQSA